MKKEKIKNILLIVIVALVTSFVTAYGVSSTFDSSNVCYKVDSNTGASVQDTIDDLYGRASDYSELNNKVSTLEGYFQYDPSSYFNGDSVSIARNSTNTSSLKQVALFNNGVTRASLYFHPSNDATYLTANDSSGTWGQGRLYLSGNPVMINGVDIQNDNLSSKVTSVSLPYTATRSGFMCFAINPSSVSGGYSTFKIGIFSAQLSAYNGEQVSSCYPIAKGETVSLTRTNNVTNSAFFKSFK